MVYKFEMVTNWSWSYIFGVLSLYHYFPISHTLYNMLPWVSHWICLNKIAIQIERNYLPNYSNTRFNFKKFPLRPENRPFLQMATTLALSGKFIPPRFPWITIIIPWHGTCLPYTIKRGCLWHIVGYWLICFIDGRMYVRKQHVQWVMTTIVIYCN